MQVPTLRIASVYALLAATLAAQPVPHEAALPRAFSGAFANAGSYFPIGRTGGRIQLWWRGDNFVLNDPLSALGFRPAKLTSANARTISLEVQLANRDVTLSTFGTSFATNLGTEPTTVLARKPISLPSVTIASDPNASLIWVPSDAPFSFLGPNLVGLFDLGPAANATNASHVSDAYIVATGDTLITTSGATCGGQLTANGTTSANLVLKLTGAPPTDPISFLLSTNHLRTGGGVPLPFDLALVGAPACFIGVDPQAMVSKNSSANGEADFTIPFPVTGSTLSFFAQAVHKTSANTLGLATTQVVHAVTGGRGLANYIYNYDADGPNAQYGPFPGDRSVIVLFR